MQRSKTFRGVPNVLSHIKGCQCQYCDATEDIQFIKLKKQFERDLISKQTDIEPEIQEIIEKRFWDLI